MWGVREAARHLLTTEPMGREICLDTQVLWITSMFQKWIRLANQGLTVQSNRVALVATEQAVLISLWPVVHTSAAWNPQLLPLRVESTLLSLVYSVSRSLSSFQPMRPPSFRSLHGVVLHISGFLVRGVALPCWCPPPSHEGYTTNGWPKALERCRAHPRSSTNTC